MHETASVFICFVNTSIQKPKILRKVFVCKFITIFVFKTSDFLALTPCHDILMSIINQSDSP